MMLLYIHDPKPVWPRIRNLTEWFRFFSIFERKKRTMFDFIFSAHLWYNYPNGGILGVIVGVLTVAVGVTGAWSRRGMTDYVSLILGGAFMIGVSVDLLNVERKFQLAVSGSDYMSPLPHATVGNLLFALAGFALIVRTVFKTVRQRQLVGIYAGIVAVIAAATLVMQSLFWIHMSDGEALAVAIGWTATAVALVALAVATTREMSTKVVSRPRSEAKPDYVS
jgi:Kef-type K+ transport system membrane component KefB